MPGLIVGRIVGSIVGRMILLTVKKTLLGSQLCTAPPGSSTVKPRAPATASDKILIATATLLSVVSRIFTLMFGSSTIAPALPILTWKKVTADAFWRFSPMIVASTVAPASPVSGSMAVITGWAGAAATVKVTPLGLCAVPAGVVALKLRVPVAAEAAMVMLTRTLLAVAETMAAVMPAPENVTAVASARLVPVMLAATVAPCWPLVALMPVIVGLGASCACTVMTT